MKEQLQQLIDKQREFQLLTGFPIDSSKEFDRNEMSEKYLFKAIEEIIELRKEFPSAINPWSKSQQSADTSRILEELSDVMLFILNFCVVWRIDIEQLLSVMERVQNNNYNHLKEKKLLMLNREIESIPGYDIETGRGAMNPARVYVHKTTTGIPMGVEIDEYHTALVKASNSTTDETNYWQDILEKELEILKINNPDCVINHVNE